MSLAAGAATPARADRFDWRLPDRSYLWDGGAVPYLYAPLAFAIGLKLAAEPPATPLWFSPREGGERYDGGQYPTAMLYVDAAVAGALILAGGDDSRWFHLKGFAQGLAMTQMLTTLAKNTFGRHRPMYDPAAPGSADARRSFWSGHSSSTLATAVYLGLYARQHIFDRWRPPGTLPWWEGLAYAGLAAAAVAIPYSQVRLHRHHVSDVIVGSAVGAGVATLFYLYQERNYRRGRQADDTLDLRILPDPSIRGITILGRW